MDYTEKFEELVKEQLKRIEKLKNEPPATDFSKLDKIMEYHRFCGRRRHRSGDHESGEKSSG